MNKAAGNMRNKAQIIAAGKIGKPKAPTVVLPVRDEQWWITNMENQINKALAQTRANLKQLILEKKLITSIKNNIIKGI